jgi:hypothetical protein
MSIHIGEKIKKRAKEIRMGPTELSRLINTSKQNIYGIFKRKSIDSDLLYKICKVLQHDFFQYYDTEKFIGANEEIGKYITSGKKQESQDCKKELKDLKEKCNEILRKVNELLEGSK